MSFRIFLLLTFLLPTSILVAQDECSSFQKENERLTKEIHDKERDIAYYKEALDLLNSKTTAENQDVVFKVTSVSGKKDQGKIVVELLMENVGTTCRFQLKGSD